MKTLSQLHQIFNNYLEENRFHGVPPELYIPVDYIMDLGGKRLRPVLLLMAYNLFRDDVENALPAAYSIEIFHNFSLVHDDIMDMAPLRRGHSALHVKYGINTGILSGDVMLIYAYQYLLKTRNEKRLVELITFFNDMAIAVCEGQQFDMNFEKKAVVSIPEYLKMTGLKTAALLAGAMKMGAIIADAPEKDTQLIYDFGKNTGIAFQLQDDLLDTYGDPRKFGKKEGGDIVQNKKTFLLLRALEIADDETKKNLLQLMSSTGDDDVVKISAVKKIFDQLNVRAEAERVTAQYLKKAYEALDALSVPEEKKQPLRELTTILLEREV